MPKEKSIIPIERIAAQIYLIRGEQVMLDSDLAELYGVPTKRLNEQVSLAQPVLRFTPSLGRWTDTITQTLRNGGAGSLCVAPEIRSSAGGHYHGEGVPQDYIQASKWVNLTASRLTGEVMDDSRLLRDKLAEIMTASQVAEAQRLAREWRPKTWEQLKDK